MAEIKDFSKKRKQLLFKIDDDVFEASPAIPAEVLMDFAVQFTGIDPEKMPVEKQLAIFKDVFELVLLPDSLARFQERLRNHENPIEMDQVEQIITWLFEEYGLRPTELPSTSPDGLPSLEPGTTSTVNTQAEVSISAASPLTGS